MPFVKLDCGVLDSSLWIDRPSRELFITALLMAIPHEVKESLPELKTRSLEETGFLVPPGWYGLVNAAGPGIVNRALLQIEEGMAALEKLAAPDPESRSQAYDGRRMVRIDGGFLILNYDKYRERDYTAADRVRRYRQRQREHQAEDVTRNSNAGNRNVTQAEAEAEAEATRVRGRATALPPDFDLTDDQVAYAKSKGIQDVSRELEAFKAHHQAHGKTMKSWPAAWRTWCLNFQKFGGRASGEKPRKLSAVERVVQATRKRDAEIDAASGQDGQRALEADGGDLRSPLDQPIWRD